MSILDSDTMVLMLEQLSLPQPGLVSPVLLRVPGGFKHYCAGCRGLHYFPVDRHYTEGNNWNLDNRDWDAPSFTPAMMWQTADDKFCHYELKFGFQHFKPDCTHLLAGKDVPLLPIPTELLPPEVQMSLLAKPEEAPDELV